MWLSQWSYGAVTKFGQSGECAPSYSPGRLKPTIMDHDFHDLLIICL